jgi:lysophospholipase L1-like esterase
MSGTDRSWTVAPVLLWFTGCLVVALCVLDGGVQVLADRLTTRREPDSAPPAGPTFTAGPVVVADAGDEPEPQAPLTTARGKILALEDVCLDGTEERCKRWAMDGFYRAVHASKQGTLERAVRVSWYGDSVIATDAIPGRFRTLLQAELGDGGPGFVYVVPPHRFCGHEAVTRSSNGTWTTHSISTLQIPDGLYGVGGSTAETAGGRATIKLVAGSASQVQLYYLEQPRGGTATVLADGAPIATVATRGETKRAGHAQASVAGGATRFEVATSGRVRLFGLALENPRGGVLDNFGVVSVSVKSFEANNAEHFRAQLAQRSADLVMIMIGANEAQWLGPTDRDKRSYTASYEKLLAEIRSARPEAACLVVSPTDQAEPRDGSYVSRAVIARVVAAQRSAARAQGCAFYSTYDWMGGKGSAAKWFRKGLVGTDLLHLSRKGANRLAEGLFGTLKVGYQTYAAE